MNYPHPNKFNASKGSYKGRSYHSKLETEFAMWLDSLLQEGKLLDVKPQHKIDLRLDGKHICNHYVDFLVTLADGREKFLEVKGFATEVWKIKQRLTEFCYPDTPYLVNPQERELLS